MSKVKLWHRPPNIAPNYGKRKSMAPKTNLTQVLLHDNVSQQQILDSQLRHIHGEKRRSLRLMDLHKKSFMVQQSFKQQHLRSIGVYHISYLPDIVAESYLGYRNAGTKSAQDVTRKRATLDTPSSNGKQRQTKSATFNLGVTIKHRDDRQGEDNKHNLPDIVNKQEPADVLKLDETDVESSKSSNNAYKRSQSAYNTAAADDNPKTKNFSTYNYRREKTLGHPSELRKSARNRFRQRSTKDPRFEKLEKSLIASETPNDGFVQLSPSGHKVLEKYGKIKLNVSDMQDLFAKYKISDNDITESPRRCRFKDTSDTDGDGESASLILPIVAFKDNSLTAEDDTDSLL